MFPRGIFWAAVFGAIGGAITLMCLNAAVWCLKETEATVQEGVSHPQKGEKELCVAAVCGVLGGIFTVLCKNGAWRAQLRSTGWNTICGRSHRKKRKNTMSGILEKGRSTQRDMFPRGVFWAVVFGTIGGLITVMCLNVAVQCLKEAEATVEEGVSHPREGGEKGFCLAAVCGALSGIFAMLCMSAVWSADEAEAGIQFVESQKEAKEHDERDP